jgi:anti-sigma regulatory factor (Ser/Thr protein kinase)
MTLRVAGSTEGIRRALDALGTFAAGHAIGAHAAWRLELALDEVLSNIVTHAYADRTAGIIDVTFALADGEFQVSVVDDGSAHDPLSAPEPDTRSPLKRRRPGGLGVHLVRKLMDHVEYARRDGRNCLVFGRRLVPGS